MTGLALTVQLLQAFHILVAVSDCHLSWPLQMNSNLPVGTPEYISPEVLTSLDRRADYGTCCDWWSVGIILYELLLEHTPFEGETTAETYANVMSYKVCKGPHHTL